MLEKCRVWKKARKEDEEGAVIYKIVMLHKAVRVGQRTLRYVYVYASSETG